MKVPDNFVAERAEFEFQKYGRRLHEEAAAHPHFYKNHSFERPYGQYSEPSPPNSNVSV